MSLVVAAPPCGCDDLASRNDPEANCSDILALFMLMFASFRLGSML